MTLVVTILLGLGVILICSALDGTSVTDTFSKLWFGHGSGLDLTGTKPPASVQSSAGASMSPGAIASAGLTGETGNIAAGGALGGALGG